MKKNVWLLSLSALIVLILFGVVTNYQIINNNNLKKENIIILKERENLKTNVENLSKELQDIQESLNKLKIDNENLKKDNENLKKEKADTLNKLSLITTVTETQKKSDHFVSETNLNEKVAYLTFDDGPSKNALKVLDILKSYNIKATFFVNGNEPSIVKRIVSDGHAIGNHTYSHDYSKIYTSVNDFKIDFQKDEDFIYNNTGIKTKIMRFPGGSDNHVSYKYGGKNMMYDIAKEMTKEGYTYFDWNIDSNDASKVTQDKNVIISSVLDNSKKKKFIIVLMHVSSPKTTTVEALPTIIEGLQKQGFTFKSLDTSSPIVQSLHPIN
jgi:peptidoglycan/xylan/chitin deacetylase (PgdA/CDA1 family)